MNLQHVQLPHSTTSTMTTEFKKLPDKQPGSRKKSEALEALLGFQNPHNYEHRALGGKGLGGGGGEKTCLSPAASGPSLAQAYWKRPKTQPTTFSPLQAFLLKEQTLFN